MNEDGSCTVPMHAASDAGMTPEQYWLRQANGLCEKRGQDPRIIDELVRLLEPGVGKRFDPGALGTWFRTALYRHVRNVADAAQVTVPFGLSGASRRVAVPAEQVHAAFAWLRVHGPKAYALDLLTRRKQASTDLRELESSSSVARAALGSVALRGPLTDLSAALANPFGDREEAIKTLLLEAHAVAELEQAAEEGRVEVEAKELATCHRALLADLSSLADVLFSWSATNAARLALDSQAEKHWLFCSIPPDHRVDRSAVAAMRSSVEALERGLAKASWEIGKMEEEGEADAAGGGEADAAGGGEEGAAGGGAEVAAPRTRPSPILHWSEVHCRVNVSRLMLQGTPLDKYNGLLTDLAGEGVFCTIREVRTTVVNGMFAEIALEPRVRLLMFVELAR